MPMQSSGLIKSPSVILGLLRIADIVTIVAAALLAYYLRHGTFLLPTDYINATIAGVLVSLQLFHLGRLYDFKLLDQFFAEATKLVTLWSGVGLTLIAIGFFIKVSDDFSRIWVGLWLALSFFGFILLRVYLKLQLASWRRRGFLTRNLLVVGAGDHARRFIEHVQAMSRHSVNLVGIFDERRSRIPREIEGVPVLGTVDDLLLYVREHSVDLIVLAMPWTAERRLIELMNLLRTVPVDVQLCPDQVGFRLFDRSVTHLAGLPMLNLFERPLTGWNYFAKRTEDFVLAAVCLAFLAPLLAVVALAVKLDSPGPILFRQQRFGFNNNLFTVFKFRTMYHQPGPEVGVPQARRADPRVTRIGALLRRTSMDELPQLWNVLRGEMSIVGPRPHAVAHNEEYAELISQYLGRHRVKPGITGWAQVNGLRGETDTPEKMERRVQFDLYYIDNWSLLLDLKIILKTLFVGFVHENAY